MKKCTTIGYCVFMNKRKTRIEIMNEGEKVTSRWIETLCGFLQGDSLSPVGICISGIRVYKSLQKTKDYKMG